jgi:CRISPR-associated protein Cas5 subtype I-B
MGVHTFLVSFFASHFKRHETKKFRSSYILPPPTAIWGIIGAIFGIDREKLSNFAKENNLIVGAEVCDFKGWATEKVTLATWDSGEKAFATSVEDFEFLVEPTFRVGVCAKDELIEEIKQRITRRDFGFDIYGGISDCFMKDIKNENDAEFVKKDKVKGMIPVNLFRGFSETNKVGRIMRVLYLNTFFYHGFNLEFKVTEPLKTVSGMAVWDINDVERFRKGNMG